MWEVHSMLSGMVVAYGLEKVSVFMCNMFVHKLLI